MAKVHYLDPIDFLSGKITKRHRTIYCYRIDLDRRYTTVYTAPTTEPTARQRAVRNKFGSLQMAVSTVLADPTQKAALMAEFRAQTKYKTLRGYVFAKMYDED